MERIWSEFLQKFMAWLLIFCCAVLFFVLIYKSMHIPMDYDEAYNLQVVDSLSKGHGYASYGALRGTGPWIFDPHITTGPALLIPLAVIWSISDGSIFAVRAFMIGFVFIFISSLFFLVNKLEGKFLLYAFSTSSLFSISLSISRVWGEIPAAALLLLAAVLISRSKILLSALIVGIAVQIKLVYGLAGIIILMSVFAYWMMGRVLKKKTIILGIGTALIPSVLMELVRYFSFGDFDLYLHSLREFVSFLGSQKNTIEWFNANQLGAKLSGLYQVMSPFVWLCLCLAMVLILFFTSIGHFVIKSSREETSGNINIGVVNTINSLIIIDFLIIAGVAMLGGWIILSNHTSPRQGLPFLFLFVPAILILCGVVLIDIKKGERLESVLGISFLMIISILLLTALVLKINSAVRELPNPVLADQVKVASIFNKEKPKSLLVDGWWQNPEYQISTNIPAIPFKTGDSQILIVQDYQVNILNSNWDTYKNMCSNIIYFSSWNLVCWLPNRSSIDDK